MAEMRSAEEKSNFRLAASRSAADWLWQSGQHRFTIIDFTYYDDTRMDLDCHFD
jgi:hypothetical protein